MNAAPKNKGGRPRRDPAGKKGNRINLYMTSERLGQLDRVAKIIGVSHSQAGEWCIEKAFETISQQQWEAFEALQKLRGEL